MNNHIFANTNVNAAFNTKCELNPELLYYWTSYFKNKIESETVKLLSIMNMNDTMCEFTIEERLVKHSIPSQRIITVNFKE